MVGNTRKRYKQIRKTPFTKKANFGGQDEEFGRPEVMYDDDLLYPQSPARICRLGRANLTGLVLGCIEAEFCKKICV